MPKIINWKPLMREQYPSTSASMRSWVVVTLFLANLVESFHVSSFSRTIVSRRTRLAPRSPSRTALCMSTSNIPTFESLRKTGLIAIAALAIGSCPLHSLAAETPAVVQELSPAEMLVQKTTEIQRARLKEEQQKQLEGDVDMAEGDLIARVLVSIKADLYELGAPDVSGFPSLDTDEARLIVAAFGKDGPPVAAKRLPVKGQPFPVIVELTVNDLAFPLTKDAWKQDARSKEDIALAVEIDPDGKAATLESESLTGYGVSKPLLIGAQMERTEATIELTPNPQLQERAEQALPPEGLEQLERVDAMLDYKEAQAEKGAATKSS